MFDCFSSDDEFAKSGDILHIPVPSAVPAVRSDTAQRSGKAGLQPEHAVDRVRWNAGKIKRWTLEEPFFYETLSYNLIYKSGKKIPCDWPDGVYQER